MMSVDMLTSNYGKLKPIFVVRSTKKYLLLFLLAISTSAYCGLLEDLHHAIKTSEVASIEKILSEVKTPVERQRLLAKKLDGYSAYGLAMAERKKRPVLIALLDGYYGKGEGMLVNDISTKLMWSARAKHEKDVVEKHPHGMTTASDEDLARTLVTITNANIRELGTVNGDFSDMAMVRGVFNRAIEGPIDFGAMLFLADGGESTSPSNRINAEQLNIFRSKPMVRIGEIIKTSLYVSDSGAASRDLVRKKLDIHDPKSWSEAVGEKRFDTIIMNQGNCVCNAVFKNGPQDQTCAGITAGNVQVFFDTVISHLNPGGRALFGFQQRGVAAYTEWVKLSEKVHFPAGVSVREEYDMVEYVLVLEKSKMSH